MSQKASTSILLNDLRWSIVPLGEEVLLLQATGDVDMDQVHATTHLIDRVLGKALHDIVPAFDSIALFTPLSFTDLLDRLEGCVKDPQKGSGSNQIFELPICYELGLDWEVLTRQTGVSKEEVVSIHLAGTYRNLFMGYTPGFVYADGLDPRLACPRKSTPRTRISAGSVGIGGQQTGIYSLDSPGGWNILGRTPVQLFNVERDPPISFKVGDRFRFVRISEDTFERWPS